MAEGGKSESFRDGSDADLEFTCTPCEEGSVTQEAVKYCPDCHEYLCKSCVIHHSRFKATRSHILTNVENAQQGQTLAVVTKCLYHPDRAVEMYCSAHDMVYCALCIATEHRSCSGVTEIEQYVKSPNSGQNEFSSLEDEMSIILDMLRIAKQKKQENVGTLENDRKKINDNILRMENTLTEYIQKLTRGSVAALKAKYDESRSEIESDVGAVVDIIEKIENMTKLSEVGTVTNAAQRFVLMKLMQKITTDAKALIDQNMQAYTGLSLSFKEHDDLSTFLKERTTLGEVTAIGGNRNRSNWKEVKLKSVKEVSVKLKTDKTAGNILDACQLPDGAIILADHKNCNIKRLDNTNTVSDCCALAAAPTAVCCTGPDMIAVKMSNNTIQFITVDSSMSVQNRISVDSGGCCGMAYCLDQLWVSRGKDGVRVYNKAGVLLKSIAIKCFKGNTQHIAADGSTIYVTDSSDGVVCFDVEGSLIKELRDSRLKYTRGVCVSPDGIAFLSGADSKNIVMFSRDGGCLGELVKDLRGGPISLCFDKRKDRIIVTGIGSIISILEL